MTQKLDLAKFKKRLEEDQERLKKEMHRNAEQEADRGSDLSDYDNHPSDAASDTFDRTKLFALDENCREILEQIEEALRKIEDGSYGLCNRCQQPINVERLKVIPYATLCINCKESLERR